LPGTLVKGDAMNYRFLFPPAFSRILTVESLKGLAIIGRRHFIRCFRLAGIVAFSTSALLTFSGDLMAAEDFGSETAVNGEDETTLIYDQLYFAEHPNAVTALDIIRRIPTGNQILASIRTGQRGFASNEDRVLVNGRRITGKQNDSVSTLGRITLEDVARIEIIRGESPDVRVSAGEAVLNVVLAQEGDGGSGTWRVMTEAVEGIDIATNGNVSRSGRSGKLSYLVSAERIEQVRTIKFNEQLFDATDSLVSRLDEVEKVSYREYGLTAGITYQSDNGGTVRLNGSYQDPSMTRYADGQRLEPGLQGQPNSSGASNRHYEVEHPIWEFSGDYEKQIRENMRLSVLGLYTQKDQKLGFGEDFLIDNDTTQDDYQFTSKQFSSESIGRISLDWDLAQGHTFEFGTEVAINDLDSKSSYLVLVNGVMEEVPLPGSDLYIREFRDESFSNYTFKPNDRLSVDLSLVAEFSEIKLEDGNSTTKRDFFFLKPAFDGRYNLSPRDQFQLQIRRRVDQLDFADFAASASIDNQTFAGNTELIQMHRWIFETGYEHRFEDDGGRFMAKLRYHNITDYVDLVPVDAGDGNIISAVGNVPSAELLQLVLEGSFRLTKWGVPDFVIEPRLLLTKHEVEDAFTGDVHGFAYWPDYQFRVEVRHDFNEMGFSYGGRLTASGGVEVHDIRDRFEMKSELFFGVFAEYQLFDGINLRVDLDDISNYDRGWNRFMFEDGTSSGVVTSRTLLTQREGLVLNVALSGSF
jgi:hypothetical protein